MSSQIKKSFGSGVIAGIALIITGALLLVQQTGFLQAIDLGRGWPMLLIVFAIMQLSSTLKETRQRGWGLLLVGDWLFANTMTDWAYGQFTGPILLAGAGAAMIVRAVRHRSESAQNHHYAT